MICFLLYVCRNKDLTGMTNSRKTIRWHNIHVSKQILTFYYFQLVKYKILFWMNRIFFIKNLLSITTKISRHFQNSGAKFKHDNFSLKKRMASQNDDSDTTTFTSEKIKTLTSDFYCACFPCVNLVIMWYGILAENI